MAKQFWTTKLRNAKDTAEQIDILKALKNAVIGHPQGKESVVVQGVLDPIIRLVFNKSGTKKDGKSQDRSSASRQLTEVEVVRLQGLHILASTALGGPPFLAPLQSAAVLPAVLSNLSPTRNPAQLVLASLRVLLNLVDSSALVYGLRTCSISAIADGLFRHPNLNSLCQIMSQTSSSTLVQTQITIAATLIGRACREERHQQNLANSGILDALATKLASFVMKAGLVIPGAETIALRDGLQDYFPEPAPPNADFAGLLEAIAAIIMKSKLRASQFLYSPSILAIFPLSQSTDFIGTCSGRAAWSAFNSSGLISRQAQLNLVDYLLPFTPLHQLKFSNPHNYSFPPLGTFRSREDLILNSRSSTGKTNVAPVPSWVDIPALESGLLSQESVTTDIEDLESPLIAYLILMIRSRSGLERLMAATVLTVLYRAGLTYKTRETDIGLLVVPLLVRMLDDEVVPATRNKNLEPEEANKLEQTIKERAPATLAMLITDNEFLQKSAFDAGIIAKLANLLKASYEPVTEEANPLPWSPHLNGKDNEPQCPHLSYDGQSPLLAHKIKVRESVLKAVAALVPFKDEYRKAVVDQGMMPYIVESMAPHPDKPTTRITDKIDKITNDSYDSNSREPKQGYGVNTINVLIAACGAVRALSRSVSILRTTLIDNGVAEPVLRLLQHPEIEVQIAATASVINLLTDVSPMRETISRADVLKTLCEYSRSMNLKLRLNAVWALKHFVQEVDNDMKRNCVEELGQGWLLQLICDDAEDEALLSSRRKEEKATSSSNEVDEDTEMGQFEEQIDTAFGTSYTQSNTSPNKARSKSIQQAEMKLAALREIELNPARKARKDDVAIQEQGLDLIRNLIGGRDAGSETTDMVDFLFSTFGQDRVFEILASKLRPKAINPYGRRISGPGESKVIPPQPEIIVAVVYILVHMAASVPRHRQLVTEQTELLKLLIPQFNNPNIEVRHALCWVVFNLTCTDPDDDANCAQRVSELTKLGFLSKLEMMFDHDPDLNVRERAKSAIHQLKQISL